MEYVLILNLSTRRSPRSNNSAVEWLSSPVPGAGGSRGLGPEYRYSVITLGTSLRRLETGKGQNQFGPAEANKSKIRSEATIQSPKIRAKRGETHWSQGSRWCSERCTKTWQERIEAHGFYTGGRAGEQGPGSGWGETIKEATRHGQQRKHKTSRTKGLSSPPLPRKTTTGPPVSPATPVWTAPSKTFLWYASHMKDTGTGTLNWERYQSRKARRILLTFRRRWQQLHQSHHFSPVPRGLTYWLHCYTGHQHTSCCYFQRFQKEIYEDPRVIIIGRPCQAPLFLLWRDFLGFLRDGGCPLGGA